MDEEQKLMEIASDTDSLKDWVTELTVREIVRIMNDNLKDDERLLIIRSFCPDCGSDKPKCQCWKGIKN